MEKDISKRINKFTKDRIKAQEKGDLREEAKYVNVLGELHTEIGQHEEALNLHKEELGLCQAIEDVIGQAVAHRKIGECLAMLGNFQRAIKHQNKHLELAKVANNVAEQQRAYTTIGRTYLIQGEDSHHAGSFEEAGPLLKKAEGALRSSIRLSQTLHDKNVLSEKEIHQMKARSITNLALVYHYLALESNEPDENSYEKQSLSLFQKALGISQKYMLSAETHQANILLTTFYRNRFKSEQAITHAQEACRNAKVARNLQWQTEALNVLGEIYLMTGNCKEAKKAWKKSYRLTTSIDGKTELREKLKSVVKIFHLLQKVESPLATDNEKFKLHDVIADKFCDLDCYQAALKHYKCQEDLLPILEDITEQQKASVFYSLALTSSDLNNHETAIEYYKKEMACRSSEPKELAKTWSQIGICMEKLNKDVGEIETCYDRAIEYADQTGDSKLQLKALNLQMDLQMKFKLPSASSTCKRISDLEMKSGILATEVEEDSEDICGGQKPEEQDAEPNCESDDEDSEALLEKELGTVSSDDSDAEESRKSRITTKVWKRKLNEKGETPLHRACIDGHLKRVQLLLEQGHPVNEPDYAGWLPLHEACNHGFADIVRVLLSHGANINYAARCGGTTPMQDAATNGHLEIVSLLLEKGANPKIQNKDGETPLDALEGWFSRTKDDLDSEEIESYGKIHDSLSTEGQNQRSRVDPPTICTMDPMSDLFDSEIFTQRTIDENGGLTQTSDHISRFQTQNKEKRKSSQKINRNDRESTNDAFVSQYVAQNGTDFGSNINDDNISDSQILPTLEPRVRNKNKTLATSTQGVGTSGADEYRQAMAGLGGSDSIAKFSSVVGSSRAPKRPSADGSNMSRGLLEEENYVGDDWLIDDIGGECSSRKINHTLDEMPSKRPKTVHLSGTGQTTFATSGWRHTNSVKKSSKSNTLSGFSSSFLSRSSVRERHPNKKLVTTKIKDFMSEAPPVEDVIIDDDVSSSPVLTSVPPSFFPSTSSVPHSNIQPIVNTVVPQTLPQPTPHPTTMKVRVKINGKMFLIPVPGSTKTIAWLCERASQVYKQHTGLQPKLLLYAGGSADGDDACLLSHDDLVNEVLQMNEQVTAKVVSWEVVQLTQKYEEACKVNKQVVIPTILNACRQCATTGRIDLKNCGFLTSHLQPLVSSVDQQEITSVLLPGNCLRDDGMTSLCESLQRQLTFSTIEKSSVITDLDVCCTNISQAGLRKLSQAADAGALKNLQNLNISCNRLGDLCSAELTTILRSCTSLRYFRASRCRFTHNLFSNSQSLRHTLRDCAHLLTLDLSHNKLGSVGVELLLKSVPDSSVTNLLLNGVCDGTNNVLLTRHISSYLKQADCQLHTLHISSNHLSTDQLIEFAGVLKNIPVLSLRSLDLSKNSTHKADEQKLLLALGDNEFIEEVSVERGRHKWKDNKKKCMGGTSDLLAVPVFIQGSLLTT